MRPPENTLQFMEIYLHLNCKSGQTFYALINTIVSGSVIFFPNFPDKSHPVFQD